MKEMMKKKIKSKLLREILENGDKFKALEETVPDSFYDFPHDIVNWGTLVNILWYRNKCNGERDRMSWLRCDLAMLIYKPDGTCSACCKCKNREACNYPVLKGGVL